MKAAVSLRDIARRARVSHVSVSNVLNRPGRAGEVSARTAAVIRKLAEEMNYVPNRSARSLSLRKTHTVVLATNSGLHHTYVHELIEELQTELNRNDLQLDLQLLHRVSDEESVYRTFGPPRCDGVVILDPSPPTCARLKRMRPLGVPVIIVGAESDLGFPSVDYDRVEAIRMGVAHLLERGHTRVAMVVDAEAGIRRTQRLQGYRAAVRGAGFAFDRTLVVPWLVGSDANGLWAAISALRPMPTGVFLYNDELAAGLLHAIRREGLRVPDDVAIVTQINSRLTRLVEVPLTAVDSNYREIAREVVGILQENAGSEAGGNPRRQVSVRPILFERESSGGTLRMSRNAVS